MTRRRYPLMILINQSRNHRYPLINRLSTRRPWQSRLVTRVRGSIGRYYNNNRRSSDFERPRGSRLNPTQNIDIFCIERWDLLLLRFSENAVVFHIEWVCRKTAGNVNRPPYRYTAVTRWACRLGSSAPVDSASLPSSNGAWLTWQNM